MAALIVAFLFICAGVYKAIDPYKFANLAKNLLVPYDLTLPLALLLAVAETTAGVLILVPRFRRWGAILAGLLLLAFMAYIGWNYKALIGRDCSCFPVLTLPFGISIDMRRSVGPGFFYGDFAFLAAAAIAGIWAKRSQGLRTAAVILGAVAVFTAVSFGSAYSKLTGAQGARFHHGRRPADVFAARPGVPVLLRPGVRNLLRGWQEYGAAEVQG